MNNHDVRHHGADHGGHRPEDPQRLERAVQRLADWRLGPAAAPAARVGRGRLLPPLAEQLHRHRQPAPSARPTSRRTASPRRPIRACRTAAATWSTGSTTSCQEKFGQTSNNITLADELRRAVSALQRRAGQRERAARPGPAVPGRHQHRQDGAGQLRRPRAGAGADDGRRRQPGGQRRQPVLPQRSRVHHQGDRARQLHRPEDRRARSAARCAAIRAALLAANWNAPVALVSAALGRPAAVVGNTVPINLVAPGEVWGDRVNALDLRFAKILRFGRAQLQRRRSTSSTSTNSDAILTYNQTLQPGGDHRAQALAGADVGADAALREDRRADRLLTSR